LVTRDGNVFDTLVIAPAGTHRSRDNPAVAADDSLFLVAWHGEGHPFDTVFAARVHETQVLDPGGFPLSSQAAWTSPAVCHDGSGFTVVWEGYVEDYERNLYGCRVSSDGVITDSFPVSLQSGEQWGPHLARGAEGHTLVAYTGWTGSFQNRAYNTCRIWGKLDPHPGIQESPKPQASSDKPGTTIVRGVLEISPRLTAHGSPPDIRLLDAAGRKVLDLHPGPNDVSGLAPGVYFVDEVAADSRQKAVTRKVVLTR
jgi:hypothetical protein